MDADGPVGILRRRLAVFPAHSLLAIRASIFDERTLVIPSGSAKAARARSVVVTGAGIVTSMGLGWKVNAEGFRAGRTALRDVSLFDTSRQRVRVAGEVVLHEGLETRGLSRRERARLDRASTLLLQAGFEAWDQSGWGDAERRARMRLVFGTSAGAMALGEAYYRQAVSGEASRRGQAWRARHYQPQIQVMQLAKALGVDGPIYVISNACASGANAIGEAFRWVRSGRCDVALCGGYDALCQLVFAGFDSLRALSPTQARPFDADRDGLALGEGAAVLSLESREWAERRGAVILGEIQGYGVATDLHHLTQPHPEGDAALASMEAACRDAGVTAKEIDYINAHGTGTPLNDVAEGRAIARWAGDAVTGIRVSSTKGAIGHLLGGAGAVETVIGLMALRGQWIPPSVHVRRPDPVCTFDLVRSPTDCPVRRVLTNSFGFGGSNATLILGQASAA